jgi:hypothetical protein
MDVCRCVYAEVRQCFKSNGDVSGKAGWVGFGVGCDSQGSASFASRRALALAGQ